MQEFICKDCNTIAILGSWNTPIFTPLWVKNNLFPLTEKGLQIEYQKKITSFRFTQDKLCFNIVNNHLQVSIMDNLDEERIMAIYFEKYTLLLLVNTPIVS